MHSIRYFSGIRVKGALWTIGNLVAFLCRSSLSGTLNNGRLCARLTPRWLVPS
jgi:hypothetical protein